MTGEDRAGGPRAPRVAPITERASLDDGGRAVFDRIVTSRGALLRPFEVLLHAPAMAERVAALGHVVRFGSGLHDADREIATLATGRAHDCGFIWASHVEAARAAGVASETIDALERREPIDGRAGVLVGFVDELCAASSVSDETFATARELLGTEGVVELVVTVGYYTMLSFVMGAAGTC